MNNKRKHIVFIISAFILIIFSTFVVWFQMDTLYRSKLPDLPDLKVVSKSIGEQIKVAERKTYWNPTGKNLGTFGLIYYSSAFYSNANRCWQLAVKKDNKQWIWSYYLGYLNLEQSEAYTSIENFNHVIRLNPQNYLALFYTGEAYQNLGLTSDAVKIFKTIAELKEPDFNRIKTVRENDFPLKTYALFRLARIYLNLNVLDSAEITLRKLIEEEITFGPAYRLLGNLYTKKGDTIIGKKYIVRANDLAEYTPPPDTLIDKIALISRSDIYLLKQIDDAIRANNFNWALRLIAHSLKYIPDNKYLISKAVFGYFSMGMDKMALPYLDQHLKYFSDDFNEMMDMADLLLNKGYDIQAMKYFNQAKKLKPGNSRLAVWLSERGMMEDAVNLLNEQLSNDPDNPKILVDAVNIMLKLGNKEKAKVYLASLFRIEPSNLDAEKLSGMIDEGEGRLKEALLKYENAFRGNPKDIYVIKYLAKIYIREKMWEKAVKHFRLALISYPNEPSLQNGLANLLILCPDSRFINIPEGIEYSERAFINFHGNMTTKVPAGKNLATAYALSGDKKNAAKYINLTTDLVRKWNAYNDYLSYFGDLKKRYNIPN